MIFSGPTPLNMTFGGSFLPFAFTARATVKLCLSAPHDNTGTVLLLSRKVQINVYALYVYQYRCELLAFVFTYIIKCVTFSLLFTLTKRVHMPIV